VAEACEKRGELEKKLVETNKKKQSTQKDVQALEAGNKTVGTIFKNKDSIGTLNREVEQLDVDIAALQQLLDLVTVYLGKVVIPAFKKDRLLLYRRVSQQFYVMEISSCHQMASFWSKVLQHEAIKGATK
jgi:hypothetical protein